MKHLLLLLFMMILLGADAGAQNYQYGFVFKAGTHNLGTRENFTSGYFKSSFWTRPGHVTTFGVFNRLKLNNRLFLSGELLLRFANFQHGKQVDYRSVEHYVHNEHSGRFWLTSLSLPVKLEWAPFKKRRTFLGVGVGISRLMNLEMNSTAITESTTIPSQNFTTEFPAIKQNAGYFIPEISYVAGIFHHLNQQTAIGLELSIEPHQETIETNAGYFRTDQIFVGYPDNEPTGLFSLTVTIRHSWL